MKRWKKFIAMGLAASMVVPTCMSQILWASEFSADGIGAVTDTFGDGTENEMENKISNEDNVGDTFETGEVINPYTAEEVSDKKDEQKEIDSDDPDKQESEQLEPEDSVNAGQAADGYIMQLYSDDKLKKTYVISYVDADAAKAPEALIGKNGYIFKEWNTKEDGTGQKYKPGDSIKELLKMSDAEMQNKKTENERETGSELSSAGEINISLERTENTKSEEDLALTEDSASAAQNETTITLYAIWEKAPSYKITYKLNKGKNNVSNPKTYTAEDEIKLKDPTRSGYHFAGWYSDSKYKKKVSTIEKGTKGTLVLYAKWIKEVNASVKAATLTSLRGVKAKTISASVTIPDYIKSIDEYYYLVYVDSNSGKVKKVAAQVRKPEKAKAKITFKLDVTGHPEYVQGKFAVAVKKSKTAYTLISGKNYVSSPEKLSINKTAYFLPKTKKGIQSTSVSQVTETKSKTVFFNLFASDIMRTGYGAEAYQYNGKTYYFSGLYNFQDFVRQCNAKGIQVTAQISLDRNSYTQDLTTGQSPYGETAFYGWNTGNSTAREKMEAAFAYLGEKFGSNDCYVSNWILGNEINSASHYYYVGNVSFSKYIFMYSEAFRCLYNAVRSSRESSKVFICLDNCWNQKNIFTVCYTSRSTLDSFASNISHLQKGINWNLAYHAYSQPLTEAKFWSSVNAPLLSSNGNTATFITMHNIQALTSYVKSKFGSGTRVILSEQGYSSSSGGQSAQAASMALAYYKAACDPMIDAFIIRSYQDENHEVAQGLALGLKDARGKKKTAYNVFCNMDGVNSLKYTKKVLNNQVGNWKAQVPGYTAKKVSGMYRK